MEAVLDHQEAPAAVSGTRSSVVLGIASAASIAANYVFLLAAGRILGSEDYGSFAALLGVLAVVLLPAGALQLAVAREVSRRIASGDADGAAAFARTTLRLALVATVPLMAIALALAVPLDNLLSIDSLGVVVLAQITLAAALVSPVATGVLQGSQRFYALAVLYIAPFAVRLTLLAVVASADYGLGGVVVATVAGGFAATGLALALIREPLRHGVAVERPDLSSFLRYLGPVAVGVIGITLVTHVDILVVKARFSGGDPGSYAAASAFARVAFFLPATILTVLFPRTAARQARGEETEDILGRSLLATAGFCGLLALFYAAAGQGLVVTTFGADFAAGGRVLAPFALAMGLFSLAQILVGYHLSRGETRYAWIVALAVVVQVGLLATLPSTLHGVVWTNLGVAVLLLAAHELFVGSSVPAIRAGLAHFSTAIGVRLRPIALEGALAFLGVTAFVGVLFWPVVIDPGGMVVGRGSDASGTIAWFWRLQHEGGYHLFGTTHHTLTGSPFGWDQGNGLNLQWLLPYYPAYLATKVVGAVATYNLVLVSGFVLSGVTMYLLARYLGCVPAVSAWAALVYVVFPWHLARTPHGSLVHIELLPLLLLALVAATRRPTAVRFLLVGLVTAGCWLTSGYFGVMAVVVAGAFVLAAALASPRRRALVVAGGSVAAAIAASIVVAGFSFAAGVGTTAGLGRVSGDLSVYGLRPLELVLPARGSLVFGHWTHNLLYLHRSNPTETSNDLGLLTIGLALAWLVIAWRGWSSLAPRLRTPTVGLTGVLVAAVVLAAPSPVGVLGHDVWTPSRVLYEIVPAIRVPSRWVAVIMTALVPLAALALQQAWTRLALRGRPLVPVAVVAAAAAISFVELATSAASPRFHTHPLPARYAALDRTPRGILAEYPLVESTDDQFWQIEHHRPVLTGAPPGTLADDARRVLLNPAAPGTASELALLGVTAVVTHADALDYVDGVPTVPNADWGRGYALVTRTGDGGSVWRVTARPAPALVTLPGGFGDPLPPHDGVVGYPLVSPAGVSVIELRAPKAGVVLLSFDATPPAGAKRELRVTDEKVERRVVLGGRMHIAVIVEIPAGVSRVLVKTDPPATSEADAVVLSAPHAEPASGEPVLHAEPVSSDPGF